jgi:hypothetical protein
MSVRGFHFRTVLPVTDELNDCGDFLFAFNSILEIGELTGDSKLQDGMDFRRSPRDAGQSSCAAS